MGLANISVSSIVLTELTHHNLYNRYIIFVLKQLYRASGAIVKQMRHSVINNRQHQPIKYASKANETS